MTAQDVDFFEKVKSQLNKFNLEMGSLSKAKPDNPINKFKLGFINEKLAEANQILHGEFQPFKDFSIFDEQDLPTNSDVVFILSQYLDCMEAWRCAHIEFLRPFWYWLAENESIKTQPPSRYRQTETNK